MAADTLRDPRRGNAPRAPRRGKDAPFGAAEIDAAALRYLNRFDATARKLEGHLSRLARKHGADAGTSRALIEALLVRYRGSGLIDDSRYARARTDSLLSRGASRRMVALKLSQSGVAREIVDEVLGEHVGPARELDAATAYVKRKRLGRFRAAGEQQDARRKDLARLARQGFDFDTAVRALGLGGEEDF